VAARRAAAGAGALTELASVLTPSPLPTAAEALADDFAGWRRIAAEPPTDPDPWVAEHLHDLVALAAGGCPRWSATRSCTPTSGRTTSCSAPTAGDRGGLAMGLPGSGLARPVTAAGQRPALRRARHPGAAGPVRRRGRGVPRRPDAALAGLAGYFTDGARRPAPPGLPTLRAFQRAQSDAVLSWLRDAPPTPPRAG